MAYKFSELMQDKGFADVHILFGKLNGEDHCWNEIWVDKIGWLVDFTADQFGYPDLILDSIDVAFATYPYEYEESEEDNIPPSTV